MNGLDADLRTVTELDIQALVDNRLEWECAKTVIEHIARSPSSRRYYDSLVEQKRLLREWWAWRMTTGN